MSSYKDLLEQLKTAKRLPMSNVKAICEQLYKSAGISVYNDSPMEPRISYSEAEKKKARAAVVAFSKRQKALRLPAKIAFDYGDPVLLVDETPDVLKLKEEINTIYKEALESSAKARIAKVNKQKEFINDVERLRMALFIGPSQELSDAVAVLAAKHKDLIK